MPDDLTSGSFHVSGKESNWSLTVGAMALRVYKEGYRPLYGLELLSAAGPSTSVKAVAAILSSKGNSFMHGNVDGVIDNSDQLMRCGGEHGYECQRARLGYDTWHLLAYSKAPSLMPNFSQIALWQKLMGPGFSTPLLREWVPWIGKQLVKENLLTELRCFQCEAAVLTATSDQLDKIVSDGVRQGHLRIEREAA